MEIRDPMYKPNDYVVNEQGVKGFVVRVENYNFDDNEYTYIVKTDETFIDEESFISEDEYNLKPCQEPPKTVWDLQNGDTYYVVDYDDMNAPTPKIVFYNDEIDLNHRKLGNCFLTKEEAEYELERRRIENEMIRLGGRRNIKICNDNYYIMYDNKTRNLAYFNRNWMHSQGSIFFDTYVDVDKAVKAIGEDRIKKYIFGVEE